MDNADVVLVAFLVCLTVGGLLAEIREALGPPLSDGHDHGFASSGER